MLKKETNSHANLDQLHTEYHSMSHVGCCRCNGHLIMLLVLMLMVFMGFSNGTSASTTERLTVQQLTSPNALVGPGPSGFIWKPTGATLAYLDSENGHQVLWLYEAETGAKKIVFEPADNSDSIDVSTAQWSPKGDALLLTGESSLWLLNVKTGELKALAEGTAAKNGVMFAPTGTHISFVQNNDLYTVRIRDGLIKRITTDGGEAVFNGVLDWVYNEELATRTSQPAYAWSPDGGWLLYLQLDDRGVENFPITDYSTEPPTVTYTRYPLAGKANPKASLHLISATGAKQPQVLPLSENAEYVLPFFSWTPNSKEVMYITVNRDHTVLELNAWNPLTGTGRIVIRETDPNWINEDRYTAPIFLANDDEFLWLSERDGFMHLYLYTNNGSMVKQITRGDWMIDSNAWNILTPGKPVHTDPSGTWAYFITTRDGPLERQLYRSEIAGARLEHISSQQGFHGFALSGDGRYLADQFSDTKTPPITTIIKTDGTGTSVLAQCAGPSMKLPTIERKFITLRAHDGADLYAQLVKPENFDPQQKYPVIVHWYGGPGLQMVSNRYGTTNIFNIIERDVLYTQRGFIVWRLDNRGSFGRGHAFETPIAGQLGPAALDDQLAGVEYLRTLPYVDTTRISTDGKSFGGFLSLYALINAPDVFTCGVAGAAPTNWSYYDTIYTERYMRTPAQNPSGYAATDLIAAASRIKGRPLLIHGQLDQNVHIENSLDFIQALKAVDKPFDFISVPNMGHSFTGDGLVTALSASVDYFERCIGD